jgi:hypothetical protein
MKKAALLAASSAALGIGILAVPGVASAADSSSYQADLAAINGSGASGSFMLTLNGTSATITEKVSGLAASFNGQPYPHVQHIHGGAQGVCPDMSADTSKDGVISTTEGAPSYGGILTSLTTSGDYSPAAGTTLSTAPSGASYTYQRTVQLDSKTIEALKGGTAVIVVHGLDPATLPAAAQKEPSDLVPSLPLAATSPALCGKVVASQMSSMPSGAADTGGGSTAGLQHEGLIAGGAALVAAGALTGAMAARRRTSTEG